MKSKTIEHNLFELSFEHASCGKAIFDIEGNIIKINDSLCKLLGYSRDEILTKNSKDLISKSLYASETIEIRKLIANECVNTKYTTIYKLKSGKTLEVEINATAIHTNGKENKPTYISRQIDLVSNTTDLQKDIKRKQFYIEKLLNEMPANIYFKDLDSNFILVNQSLVNQFKVDSADDLIGKSDFDFFEHKFAQAAYDEEQEIIKTGSENKSIQHEIWANGTETWASVTKKCLLDEDGEVIGTFGISKDVTESKKQEKEINLKNKELNVTIASLKEAQSNLVNAEKLAALGQLIAGIAHEINTPLGAINASNSNIRSSSDLLIECIERDIVNFNCVEIELLKRLNSSYKRKNIDLLTSKEKRKIKKDIIERLTIEGYSKSSKIADIIVYLNQVENLDSILQYNKEVDLLKVLVATKNMISLTRNSENISIAIGRASSVVLALKKYVHRSNDEKKSATDIADNIETVLTLNNNKIKQGIEVIKNYETIPNIDTYPDEISQVWNNLITNAMHAMDNKGKLTIDIINVGENIQIKVTDSGCGIPEDLRKKIFTPFFTTKISGEGTGLGLDIIKRIVDKHNGEITLDSEVGKGTTFTIQLPKK